MLLALLLAIAGVPSLAIADEDPDVEEQEDEEDEQQEQDEEDDETAGVEEAEDARAPTVDVLDGVLTVPRPTGWVALAPSHGAAVIFRSSADSQAQIDIRYSDQISQARWDRYLRTFDNDLQERGFRVHSGRTQRTHAGRRGRQQEYEVEIDDRIFRLVIWHFHENNRAWIFSAFFPAQRQSAHGQTFEELLNGAEWH